MPTLWSGHVTGGARVDNAVVIAEDSLQFGMPRAFGATGGIWDSTIGCGRELEPESLVPMGSRRVERLEEIGSAGGANRAAGCEDDDRGVVLEVFGVCLS
jgi:hypothetical protein